MLYGKKVVVVMPAYNAEKTLWRTYVEVQRDIVDEVILVDDHSRDNTSDLAKELGIEHVIRHEKNKGYGGNQKTCYDKALEVGADIVIMVHPDYQYTPKLIPAMAGLIATDVYPAVFGSRILGNGALKGDMPMIKYIANRLLSFGQNVLLWQNLSEYHTGYRAYSREVLETIDYHACSDDFIFDNQLIAQVFWAGFDIAEITCPTKYFEEASSINFMRSSKYAFGCMGVSWQYRFAKWGLGRAKIFKTTPSKKSRQKELAAREESAAV